VIFFSILVVILISGASCESVDTSKVDQLEQEVTQIKEDISSLKADVASLKGTVVKEETPADVELVTTGNFDLSAWTADDILNKFKESDVLFSGAGWYNYDYSGKNYYDQTGQSFYGEDEFYELAYKTRSREANVSHLRVFKMGLNIDPKEEYKTYKAKVNAKSSTDSAMQCTTTTECAGVEVTQCTKNKNKLFIWYADSYLFTARDNGEALEVFQKFYC